MQSCHACCHTANLSMLPYCQLVDAAILPIMVTWRWDFLHLIQYFWAIHLRMEVGLITSLIPRSCGRPGNEASLIPDRPRKGLVELNAWKFTPLIHVPGDHPSPLAPQNHHHHCRSFTAKEARMLRVDVGSFLNRPPHPRG